MALAGTQGLLATITKIAFYPPGGKNFVDAEEAARGVVNAMEKGRKGACYLLAGENHSYLDFFRIVKKISKQKKYRKF